MLTPFTLPFKRPANWWGIRIYYFLFLGGFGFLWPFMTLFYARQGLSGTQIGVLGSIGAFVGLLAAPLWGRWSDRVASPHRLLQISFVTSIVLMFLVSQQTAFLLIAILIGLNEIAIAGAEPLSTVLALRPAGRKQDSGFGSIRLWGSLGWAIMVFFSGLVIERTGIFSAFIGYAISLVGTVLLLGILYSLGEKRYSQRVIEDQTTWQVLRQLFRNRMLLGLAGALMIGWVSRLGVLKFEPLFMESLGAGESIIGLASTLGALIELPAMLMADHLIKKVGAWRLLQINYGLNTIMTLGIMAFPSIPTILISRLVAGIAYSLLTISLVVYLNDHAPYGQSATMLALYTITLRSIIVLLGSPIVGRVYDTFGAYWLYTLSFVGTLISLGIIVLIQINNPLRGEHNV